MMPNYELKISTEPVPYAHAMHLMEERVNAIIAGTAKDLVWFLEHEPVYTVGSGTRETMPPTICSVPVISTGRGGKITYHGPGQRVVYLMVDLRAGGRTPDLRDYIRRLEQWIINALAGVGVQAHVIEDKTGVWVLTPRGTRKIASIGIRVRKWVAFHGVAINIDPEMTYFDAISPCGLGPRVMTSLREVLGTKVDAHTLNDSLRAELRALC